MKKKRGSPYETSPDASSRWNGPQHRFGNRSRVSRAEDRLSTELVFHDHFTGRWDSHSRRVDAMIIRQCCQGISPHAFNARMT